jgi:hypothetical protein
MTQLDITVGETMVRLRTGTPLRLGGTMTMTVACAKSNVAIGLAPLAQPVRWGGRVGPRRSAPSSWAPCGQNRWLSTRSWSTPDDPPA